MSATSILKYLVRALVSMTLMLWLFSQIEISEIINSWRGINWIKLIILITLIHAICLTLRSFRLRTILNNLDLNPPLWWLALNQLKGTFFRSFTPGEIAGDIYRTYALAKKTARASESFSSIVVEKSFGVLSMFFLSLVSLLYGMYWLNHPIFKRFASPILVVSSVVFVAIIVFGVLTRSYSRYGEYCSSEFYAVPRKILGQIASCFSDRWNFVHLSLISLLLQLAIVSWYFAISKSLEFHLSFLVLMATIPLVELLLLIPISIGGIGVRDTAFVILLVPFGLTVPEVLSFSILSFSVSTVVTALSGVAFLFDFDSKKELPSTIK